SNSYPQSVLKRLLATPGRRLPRGRLLEDLWPDGDEIRVEGYLNKSISTLRHLLGKDLVTNWRSTYELAGQNLIWVDADASQSLLIEAENLGERALAVPLLETALSLLSRGVYLEREDGAWCHALRNPFERLLKQCRLWLAEGYTAQGKFL